MVSKTIAKEIVDQAISHFEKQENPENPIENSEEHFIMKRKRKERYEPSAEFFNVFSQIMGPSPETSMKLKLNEKPEPKNRSQVTKDAEPYSQSISTKSDTPQMSQESVDANCDDDADKTDQSSVFEKLSSWAVKDAEPYSQSISTKSDTPQMSQESVDANRDDDADKTDQSSVFEKLSSWVVKKKDKKLNKK